MTSDDLFRRTSNVRPLCLLYILSILDCIDSFHILPDKPIITASVSSARLMWVMRLGLLSREVVNTYRLAVVRNLPFTAINPSTALALRFGESDHVEGRCFRSSAFHLPSNFTFSICGHWERIVFPSHGHDLVIANIIIRFIDTAAEPWAAINFTLRGRGVIIFR